MYSYYYTAWAALPDTNVYSQHLITNVCFTIRSIIHSQYFLPVLLLPRQEGTHLLSDNKRQYILFHYSLLPVLCPVR